MMKITVLYGHPADSDAFESYYAQTHLPLAHAIPGLEKLQLTRFIAAADGSAPAYYRMAELYFADKGEMEQAMGSAQGKAAVDDLDNFATGGVMVTIGIADV